MKKKKNADDALVAALTVKESAQMEKVQLLEKRHHCQQHKKPCVVQDDGFHYHLTINDLAKWALLMVCSLGRLKFPLLISANV